MSSADFQNGMSTMRENVKVRQMQSFNEIHIEIEYTHRGTAKVKIVLCFARRLNETSIIMNMSQ